MSRPPSSKPRKQTASQALVTALANQTKAMEDLTRTLKAHARVSQQVLDALIESGAVDEDDSEPFTYMDGSRVS